ncbi:MAG: 23S rRNA (pseudouridine(1915)-N(3))-methyltransferase RlmH [Terriglobales bacterium]
MRLTVAWVGKSKSPALRAATDEYLARLGAFSRLATVTPWPLTVATAEAQLRRQAAGARLWLCDPAGRGFDSPAFARWLEREGGAGRELVLTLGGADGFSAATRTQAAGAISLSPLTFSHELARVVLLEQLYRALAILSHHPYPH